jgi:hypothetical protein
MDQNSYLCYWLSQLALLKCPRLGGLKNSHWCLSVLKSEIKVATDSFLSSCTFLVHFHSMVWGNWGVSSFSCKDTTPIMRTSDLIQT